MPTKRVKENGYECKDQSIIEAVIVVSGEKKHNVKTNTFFTRLKI